MMKKTLSAGLISLAALVSLAANAAQPLVRFDGGIGSQPLKATGASNVVHLVSPGGLPWVISRLTADVGTDGSIRVDGRGLLLAGGDGIGTPGGQSVKARLFCDGAPFNSAEAAAVLDAHGDFTIGGNLESVPPSPCLKPTLLILRGDGGAWFAAGIPKP